MTHSVPNALGLTTTAAARLRAQLPDIATQTVAAVVAEVPSYASAFDGPMGAGIAEAVQMALAGFLILAARPHGSDPSSPLQPALDAAYTLGRREARSGRTMDALLSAYRVGARVAWREMAAVAVGARLPAATMAQFAELVFAYIDELSAASVSGHTDELAASDRMRLRDRDRLARSLLAGDALDVVQELAARAEWVPPATLTAVLIPGRHARGLRALADQRWLTLTDDLPGVTAGDDLLACLVPDLGAHARVQLRASLTGREAAVGPSRPWTEVRRSFDRALRARTMGLTGSQSAIDTEEHLAELTVGADADALLDLRAQALAPLAGLRDATAHKLAETLRAWLLHQGRREDVASALFVHPQTIRYRMTQVRELFGDRLDDPEAVFALIVALGSPR